MAIGANNQDDIFNKLVALQKNRNFGTYNSASQQQSAMPQNNDLSQLRQTLASQNQNINPQLQKTQLDMRDAIIGARTNPQGGYGSSLEQSLLASSQGKPQPTNQALSVLGKVLSNPVTKTVFLPFEKLDPLRRGVISAVRESVDALDSDPTTTASWNDWAGQAKNKEYGFGTAFPMKGWTGRIVGFLGDVLLDPITWATLGTSVPETASLRVATEGTELIAKRLGVEAADLIGEKAAQTVGQEGERVSLRAALGAKQSKLTGKFKNIKIHSLETRSFLGRTVSAQQEIINGMTDAELLAINALKEPGEQLIRRSQAEMDKIEQLIIKYGKRHVPADLARDIGLPKAGIYYAGSRIKVPFSGTVAGLLEDTLSHTRVLLQSKATGPIASIIKNTLTDAGRESLIDVKAAKSKLLTGRDPITKLAVTAEEARVANRMLADSNESKIIGTLALETYQNSLKTHIEQNPDLTVHKDFIHKIIDKSEDGYQAALANATDGQRNAVKAFEAVTAKAHQDVIQRMKAIDPNFQVGKIERYFPHQMTQAALDYTDNVRNPHVADIRAFIKKDATDATSAFNSRTLAKGSPWFGVPLTQAEIDGGIETLNSLATARGFRGGNFFETDAVKVLQKYGKSFSGEMAKANFLEKNFKSGVLAQMVAKGEYDGQTLKFLAEKVKEATVDVTNKSGDVSQIAKNLITTIDEALQTNLEGSTGRGGLIKNIAKNKAVLKNQKVATKTAQKSMSEIANNIDTMIEKLTNTGLTIARDNLNSHGMSGVLLDDHISKPLNELIQRLEIVGSVQREYKSAIAAGTASMADFNTTLAPLKAELSKLEKNASALQSKMQVFDSVHAHLGEFINGKFSELAAANLTDEASQVTAVQLAKEGFGTEKEYKTAQKILGLLSEQSLRDKIGLTQGGKLPKDFRKFWTSDVLATGEKIKEAEKRLGKYTNKAQNVFVLTESEQQKLSKNIGRTTKQIEKLIASRETGQIAPEHYNMFQKLLDPKGKISQNALSATTIEDVRNIISRSSTSGQSLDDLHRAIVWMTVRDVTKNESIIADVLLSKAINPISPGISSLSNTEGSVARINKMVNLINEVNQFQDVMNTAGRTASGKINPKIPTTKDFINIENSIENVSAQIVDVQEKLIKLSDSPIGNATKSWDVISSGRESEKIINTNHVNSLLKILDIPAFQEYQNTLTPLLMNGELTYENAKTALNYLAEDVLLAGDKKIAPEFSGLEKQLQELKKQHFEFSGVRDQHIASLSKEEKAAFSTVLGAASHAERVLDFSNNALEYYIYSDTKHQFNNLMDNLASFGLNPTEGIYQKLLEQVSGNQLAKTKVVAAEFDEAMQILEQVRNQVLTYPASRQGSAMREIFQQIFKTEQYSIASQNEIGQLLDRVMPELRPSVQVTKISDFSRVQANDEVLNQIRADLVEGLRDVRAGGQAGVPQRAGFFKGASGETVPSVKGFTGTEFRAPKPGKQQLGINELISKLGGESIAVTKDGVKTIRSANTKDILRQIEDVRNFIDNNQSINDKARTEFNAFLTEKSRLAQEQLTVLKNERDVQKALREAGGLPSSVRKAQQAISASTRVAKDTSFNYGFSGKLNLALNAEQGWPVQNFFSDMLGGKVRNLSSGVRVKSSVASEQAAKIQAERFKEIAIESSYSGIVKEKILSRRTALQAMTDPQYPVGILSTEGSVAPGLTGGNILNVESRINYADVLAERANEIRQSILSNKDFNKKIVNLEREAKTLFDSNIDQLNWVAEQLKREQQGLPVPLMTKYAAEPNLLIKDLPKGVQKNIAQMRGLMSDAASLASSPEYLIAQHDETVHNFLLELSRLNMHEIVDLQGKSGIYFESSGTQKKFSRLWNASGNDDKHISIWATQQAQDSLAYRTADSAKSAFNMQEVPFSGSINLDTTEYFLKNNENIYRKLSIEELNSLQPSQYSEVLSLEYKPFSSSRKKFTDNKAMADYLRNSSSVKTNTQFNPNETWYKLDAQSAISGAKQSASEGATTLEAKPEVWVKYANVNPATTEPIINTSFTKSEWESLFRPDLKPSKGKIAELRGVRDGLNNRRLKIAEKESLAKSKTEKLALRKKFHNVDIKFQKAEEELNMHQQYGSAMIKVNALLKKFEDKNIAPRIGLSEKNAGDPVAGIRKWVETQLDGYGLNEVTVGADEKVVSNRLNALHEGWLKNSNKDYIDAMKELQNKQNDIAFSQWSSSISEQYSTYTQTLDGLNEARGMWTNQNVIDKANEIVDILDKPIVSEVIGKKGANTAQKISERIDSLTATGTTAQDLLAQESTSMRRGYQFGGGQGASIQSATDLIKGTEPALRNTANNADVVAEQLRTAALPPAVVESGNYDALRNQIVSEQSGVAKKIDDLSLDIKNLDFEKLLKTTDINRMTQTIASLDNTEKTLLQAKVKTMEVIEKTDNKRMQIVMDATRKSGIKSGTPVDRLLALEEAQRLTESSYDQAKHAQKITERSIAKTQKTVDILKDLIATKPKIKSMSGKTVDTWLPETKIWVDEAVATLEKISKDKSISPKTKDFMVALMDGEAALQMSKSVLTTAQSDFAAERGFKLMFEQTGINLGPEIIKKSLEQGYEMLNKDRFPNVMVKSAYAEILRNANAFSDPFTATQFGRIIKKWNSYWKPLATTTPGFHVRNNINNIMAMGFGGANPLGINEGTDIAFKWLKASGTNMPWDDFIKNLPKEQQYLAYGAKYAMVSSGGGAFDDVITAENKLQNMLVLKKSRELGIKSDDFARFVFSYDAMKQGFTPEQAALRTKRFYFDYQDVSTLDETMRQIVPFWMWTSRNTVTQLQNQWLNPRPYAIYNSFKRNFEDKNTENIVPKGWKELGAFKLPFGKDLYVMPDLGFTRVQQQFEMAQTPSRFLGDINPLIRVPAELALDKQAFYNKPIGSTPVQTSGVGLASALQPLAQMLGAGETNSQGNRFIDPRLLYLLTAGIPPFATAERLNPSQGSSPAGWNANAISGFVGSPTKQLDAKAQNNELLRRLFEMRGITARNKAVNTPQG